MKCDLCPRKCLVDRKKGEKGICGQTENLKVARAALHFWDLERYFFRGVRCIVYSVRMRISQTERLEKKSLWSGSWIFFLNCRKKEPIISIL